MSESKTIISTGGGGTAAASGGASVCAAGGGDGSGSSASFIAGVSRPELLHDAAAALHLARQDGFDYVVTALPDTAPLLLPGSDGVGGWEDGRSSAVILNGTPRDPAPTRPVRAKVGGGVGGVGAGDRADVTRLESKWWSTSVVGTVADPPRWGGAAAVPGHGCEGRGLLEALTTTSNVPAAVARREESRKIFLGMMEWASHMNIPAVILPPVPLAENLGDGDGDDIFSDADGDAAGHHKKRGRVEFQASGGSGCAAASINNGSAKEYARLVAGLAASPTCSASHVQLWLRVPLTLPAMRAYQLLLTRCDHSPSVGCVLHVSGRLDPADLPGMAGALHGFLGGGNVKAVSWDAAVFLKNKRGYPTLSKNHQFLFSMLFGRLGRTLRTLVEGVCDGDAPGGAGHVGGGGGATWRLHHLQYLRHLRSRPPLPSKLDTEEAAQELPYLDSLQSPLQPLGDHLEYQTYETFERDPVKYRRYGEAVGLALEDGIRDGRFAYLGATRVGVRRLESMMMINPEDDESYGANFDIGDDYHSGALVDVDVHSVTILVVGAGRGPLVRETVNAVSRVSGSWMRELEPDWDGGRRQQRNLRRRALQARVVAIEKNPSAVLYLRSLRANDPSWNGGRRSDGGGPREDDGCSDVVAPGASIVTVIGCDMRRADTLLCHPLLRRMMQGESSSKADIVVSELLGSFGDNELSPECLDGVQACGLLGDACVSIPQSYTAFLAPVSSTRLHSEARAQSCLPLNANDGPASPPVGMQRALETPYVVRSHSASQTHAEQPCWTFTHPCRGSGPLGGAGAVLDRVSPDDPGCGASVRVAGDVFSNDRHAHLSFKPDPSRGAGHGCGYGPLDPETASVAAAVSPPSPVSLAARQLRQGKVGEDGVPVTVHGFLGTFYSMLYQSPAANPAHFGGEKSSSSDGRRSSAISIAPGSFSVGMFSWFPLYFPLREPLQIPPGAEVDCSMWRRSDGGRVWYEWCAEVVMPAAEQDGSGEAKILGTSPIHNPGGRSYHVKKW